MAIWKKRPGKLSPDATMDEILTRHPEVIAVMNRYDMLCVGCLLAPFHDIWDAAREHGLDPEELYEEVRQAIDKAQSR